MAVKLFRADVRLDDAVLEAQLQRRLSAHPRVVGLRNLDVRTSAGPIVVSEYMPGGSVDQRCAGGTAGLLASLRWTLDAADALVHAHAHGVFHRDAKPSNLLLDPTGHASLCDFGVAEDSFNGGGDSMLYQALAAPEQPATGTTEQTEVWMLGTLLYRLLFGVYPHPSGAVGLPADARVNAQALSPQIPMALSRVLERALAVSLSERYATVLELRQALLAINVVTEFTPVHGANAIERWQASLDGGVATVDVIATPRSTFSARLRIDRGAGPRTVNSRPRRSTRQQAFRDARTLLRAVVEGRLP